MHPRRRVRLRRLMAAGALLLAAPSAPARAADAAGDSAFGVSFERRLPATLRLPGPVPGTGLLAIPAAPLRTGHLPTHPAVPRRWTRLRVPLQSRLLGDGPVLYMAELNRLDQPVRLRAVFAAGDDDACVALQGELAGRLEQRYAPWEAAAYARDVVIQAPDRGELFATPSLLVETSCAGQVLVLDYTHRASYRAYQQDYEAQIRQWRANYGRRVANRSGGLDQLFGIAFGDPIPDLRNSEVLAARAHVYDLYLDFDPERPLPELPWMAIRDVGYRLRTGPDGRPVDVRARIRTQGEDAAEALFAELTAIMRVHIGAPSKRTARHWIFESSGRFLTLRWHEDDSIVLAGTDAGALRALIERRRARAAALRQASRERDEADILGL